MLKLVGAAVIFVSCAWFGWLRGQRLTERVREIRRLIYMLQRLETEIAFSATPLVQAVQRIAGHPTTRDAQFFRRLADDLAARPEHVRTVWQSLLDAERMRGPLQAAELEALAQLGESLGISDREDQIKHLHLAVSRLLAAVEEARAEEQKYRAMWRSLGVLGGALLVVLMY
jgi:stage III sporulation protein AB